VQYQPDKINWKLKKHLRDFSVALGWTMFMGAFTVASITAAIVTVSIPNQFGGTVFAMLDMFLAGTTLTFFVLTLLAALDERRSYRKWRIRHDELNAE
jgi:hypothetical protein